MTSIAVAPALAGRAERTRSPAVAVALAIAAFPILKPEGPSELTVCDVLMAAAIVWVTFWAGSRRLEVHLPYVVPFAVLAVTGIVAALFSIAPGPSVLAVVKDAFVFLWAAAIANVIRDVNGLSIILASWAWSAVAWATFAAVAVVSHQWSLVGVADATGGRVQLRFDNPNMAGNYFLISLFVVLLSRYPRRPLARAYACGIILAAVALTGSLAGLLSLGVSLVAVGFFTLWRRTDPIVAVAISAMAGALLLGMTYYVINTDAVQRLASSSNPVVERSLGRSSKSAEGRQTLFEQEVDLYRTGSLLGRGPATTKANLAESEIVKEAHDDYIATLIERGPIGVVGLIILIGAIGVRAWAVAMRPLLPRYAEIVTSPIMLIGCLLTMAATATTHEILHYRHVWALLGILAGLYLFGREKRDPVPAGATATL